jgi:hypothetical protein
MQFLWNETRFETESDQALVHNFVIVIVTVVVVAIVVAVAIAIVIAVVIAIVIVSIPLGDWMTVLKFDGIVSKKAWGETTTILQVSYTVNVKNTIVATLPIHSIVFSAELQERFIGSSHLLL